MDLVELMKKEIFALHLTDKRDIQNHIYQRIGEIFEYDPYWKFASVLEQYKKAKQKIDVHNVTNFYEVCFNLAPMAVELFKAFDIEAREDGNVGHSFVVTTIDGKDYTFDLTQDYEDLMRIKFGLKILYHYDSPSHNDNRKYKHTEAKLNLIKQKLEQSMTKLSKDEYIFQVYQTIEKILDFFEPENVDIVSGVEFINYLLKYFIGKNYISCNARFYNRENNSFVEVYSILVNGNVYYFTYQKMDKKYVFQNAKEEEVQVILNHYIPDKSGNLILLEGQQGYLKYKKLEDKVKKVKKQLHLLTTKLSFDEYIYEAFKTIEKIMVFDKTDKDNFTSGVECVQYLLRLFVGEKDVTDSICFYNQKNKSFSEVFTICVNRQIHYFAYELVEESYKLLEVTAEYINNTLVDIPNELKDETYAKRKSIYLKQSYL